ncbi:FecCD family ABC transporter permease [Aquibacillus rhizosphaerae]|uniref:Iron ABC transporter permease n=1 Tax=Aquibacillus rhizosphaerae TaxID=3051431 RepID=A0ABT7L8G9_9BACI|nr:iron ABC transporter permease [Aquibacillus sp. LR5S19]MDL4842144.1 iron ABC transporter permease [Aquibacillus sp. LR5S19]
MFQLLHTRSLKIIGVIIGVLLLLCTFFLSIVLGATEISLKMAFDSFVSYDSTSTEQVIIQTTRVPRAIIASIIGANLAIAGALMQALTRNPLASPSIFGINAGAICFVVLAISFFPISSLVQLMWIAFLGAGIAALSVYYLGTLGNKEPTPVKIVLAGAAITALFSSFTQGMLVLDEAGLQDVLFWLAGSVSGRSLEMLLPVLPYILVSFILALGLAYHVNILASGEDVAKGLGQRTGLVKILIAITVVLLAGSAVAVVGAIGFIGLIVPHIARFLVGVDYRWIIPYCALVGAILLLIADIIGRFPIKPEEIPIGVMTSLIGAPFFIYMVRKGLRHE